MRHCLEHSAAQQILKMSSGSSVVLDSQFHRYTTFVRGVLYFSRCDVLIGRTYLRFQSPCIFRILSSLEVSACLVFEAVRPDSRAVDRDQT